MIEKLIPVFIKIIELLAKIIDKWLDQDDKLE